MSMINLTALAISIIMLILGLLLIGHLKDKRAADQYMKDLEKLKRDGEAPSNPNMRVVYRKVLEETSSADR